MADPKSSKAEETTTETDLPKSNNIADLWEHSSRPSITASTRDERISKAQADVLLRQQQIELFSKMMEDFGKLKDLPESTRVEVLNSLRDKVLSLVSRDREFNSGTPAGFGAVSFRLVEKNQASNGPSDLTTEYLQKTVVPYLQAVADIQSVLNEIHGRPSRRFLVKSITEGSVDVNMSGVAETIDKIDSIVEPWRRKYAQRAADLELSEKQADIEKKNAEVLQMRAQAAKTREERSVLEAEAALKWAQAQELELKNQKAKLELEREKMKMYLEFIGALGVDLSPEDKLFYVTKLKSALDTITDSPLMLAGPALKPDEGK